MVNDIDSSAGRLPSIPGYDLIEELGRGGMGVVYKGRSADRSVDVAIKVIRDGRAASLGDLARFRIEAEVVACLRHPNIVPILGVGVTGGFPFLVFEYIAGGTLKDRTRKGPQDPGWSASVALNLANGVHYAHRHGVIHRDLKPQNVLLGEDGVPKLADFGLAAFTISRRSREHLRDHCVLAIPLEDLVRMGMERGSLDGDVRRAFADAVESAWSDSRTTMPETPSLDEVTGFVTEVQRQIIEPPSADSPLFESDLTQTGDVIGTPVYMSPEQASGRPSGREVDVYALGAVLYEMLSGQPPFAGSTTRELLEAVRTQSPRPIKHAVPDELRAIYKKCLEKDPRKRFSSAAELADALEAFLRNRAASAGRE